jgi:hypothetical protein
MAMSSPGGWLILELDLWFEHLGSQFNRADSPQ